MTNNEKAALIFTAAIMAAWVVILFADFIDGVGL